MPNDTPQRNTRKNEVYSPIAGIDSTALNQLTLNAYMRNINTQHVNCPIALQVSEKIPFYIYNGSGMIAQNSLMLLRNAERNA